MKLLITIAAAEWRCWLRSRLAVAAAVMMVLLLLATTVHTAVRMQAERTLRAQQQTHAEDTFRAQPDRHPHRMVHYGHYVFRTPAPLSMVDPGLDGLTGQSLFLEGHRQNTPTFAATAASADLGALSRLNLAWVYQVLVPLLLVLLGHGALVREREAGTLATLLAQGLGGRVLLAGKALALAALVGVLLLPLALVAAWTVIQSETAIAAWALLGLYGLYLLIWAWLSLLASALWKQRGVVLAILAVLWMCYTLVLPALAVSATKAALPIAGKIETDLSMLRELRKLGDGHNANDPAFAQFRSALLERHGVQRVEDLPFNLRGVVAEESERRLTETLNRWARQQRKGETSQTERLRVYGVMLPMLALAEASRKVAGTDLHHHHRFLEEAEQLRYEFVQGLNRVHAQHLAYADDIRRSSDPQSEQRTRVAAAHWRLLERFRFEPDHATARVARAAPMGAALLLWLAGLSAVLIWVGRRLRP